MKREEKQKTRIAILVGAGEFTDRDLPPGEFTDRGLPPGNGTGVSGATQECVPPTGEERSRAYIVAADGGLTHLEAVGLVPDLVIGDFDSLGYIPAVAGISEVRILPVEKDDTDMEAAIRAAWEEGCRAFRLYGAYGDRPDHFLANLQLLADLSRRGADACLVAPQFTVYARTNGRCILQGVEGAVFSVFTLEKEARGVTISGNVKYPLHNGTLTNDRSLGVSNQLTGPEAFVEVADGTVLVFLYEG